MKLTKTGSHQYWGIPLLYLTLFVNVSEAQHLDMNYPEENQSNVQEIIVVCKTHFDIGFTHRVDEVIPYFQTSMIDQALSVMEQSEDLPADQQFVWTAPAWVMSKVLEDWEGQTQERREKLEDAFKSGRFVSHALPFTSHSDIMSAEEFARGTQYSSLVAKKYGLPLPYDAKVTDVPSHSTTLATGLANSGVRFIHIGCNWPSGSVDYPGLFWWEGPDGSRILTLYSSIYSSCTALWPEAWGGNKGEDHPGGENIGTNLLPPKGWPHKVWLAILVTPDNSGPPKEEALKPLFDEVAEKMPGVKIRMGRMQDFADAIIESGADLPVVKKEAPDTWIHGVMSDPGGMKVYRNLQTLAPSAEVLNTQMQYWKLPVDDATEQINMAYENIMLYAEHTWGMAQIVEVYGDEFHAQAKDEYKNLEDSWEDKTNYVRKANKIIQKTSDSDLATLASSVDMEGERVLVYNSLPWQRSELIEIPDSDGQYLFAEDIPANGYKTFPLHASGANRNKKDQSGFIENEYYKISFDANRGIIKSLIDKKSGKDWVVQNSTEGLGQYVNERFTYEQCLDYTLKYQNKRAMGSLGLPENEDWPHPGIHKPGMISDSIVPYRAASPTKGSLSISKKGLIQTAVLKMPGDPTRHLPATELHISLKKGMPYLDIECKILNKKKDNWPEADWLCLPFNIDDPTFKIGRALGTINPETDLLPGANRHLFAVGSGVTITDSDGSGVAIVPLDHPLVSLGEHGIWKFSRDYVPEKPTVYLNLYNNMWNTNFRYWYPGSWSSRVRLWTFAETKDSETKFLTASLEARTPLLAKKATGKKGNLPVQGEGIKCSRSGVVITAFSQNFNKEGKTIFRVWEQAGNSGKLRITFPPGMNYSKAQAIDIRGENSGDNIPIVNGELNFELGKYAPASFILSL